MNLWRDEEGRGVVTGVLKGGWLPPLIKLDVFWAFRKDDEPGGGAREDLEEDVLLARRTELSRFTGDVPGSVGFGVVTPAREETVIFEGVED